MGKLATYIRSLRTVLVLLLFIAYSGSVTLFWHSHYVNNVVIAHSHPCSSNSHDHSSNEYLLIDKLSCFIAVFVVILGLCKFISLYKRQIETPALLESLGRYSFIRSGRAPPLGRI